MTSWNKFLDRLKTGPKPQQVFTFGVPTFFTKGKWIKNEGRVGIIANLDAAGTAELHYVNNVGETVEVAFAPISGIAIAGLMDIPLARRPSREAGNKLGYF